MKFFPVKEYRFKLVGDQTEALDRLYRRTEKSENLISDYTDSTFRGKINGTHFNLISSNIGRGAFCVMTGEIEAGNGKVR